MATTTLVHAAIPSASTRSNSLDLSDAHGSISKLFSADSKKAVTDATNKSAKIDSQGKLCEEQYDLPTRIANGIVRLLSCIKIPFTRVNENWHIFKTLHQQNVSNMLRGALLVALRVSNNNLIGNDTLLSCDENKHDHSDHVSNPVQGVKTSQASATIRDAHDYSSRIKLCDVNDFTDPQQAFHEVKNFHKDIDEWFIKSHCYARC